MAVNWKKYKALVHYICEKADDPSVLGSIKLNKVLWYADTISYMVTGRAITGVTYVKRQHGPVPQAVIRAIDELVKEGKIARGKADHFGYTKHEYIAVEEADKSLFSGAEIALVDEAFDHVCLRHTAKSVSEETHGVIWNLAEMGEELPYDTVFAGSVGEINEDDMAWARETLAKRAARTEKRMPGLKRLS
ncbi:MAG TPA: Panacea domain-containing protein [Polyangiaceae bacterium]|nr:Panacea domain-containing protein [Polyangiaceae bacterium]